MSDEIKSWVIMIFQMGLITILCPDPVALFHKASIFRYVMFSFAIILILSPFYKSASQVFKENRGMTTWGKFKGVQYFYYFVLLFFAFDQAGYLVKILAR